MKRLFLFLCLFTLAVPCTTFAAFYNPDTGHWYDYVYGGSWYEAENAAVSLGGHLVTINDQAEQNWLLSKFAWPESSWIGLNDIAQNDAWVWVSGEAVTYTNWAPNQPDNYLGKENVVAMNWGEPGKWNDGSAYSGVNVGIAEYAKNPVVPVPPTVWLFGSGLIGLIGLRRKFASYLKT